MSDYEDEYDFDDGDFGDVDEGAAPDTSDDEEELEGDAEAAEAGETDGEDETDGDGDGEDEGGAAPAAGPRIVRHTGKDRVTTNAMSEHEYSGVLQRVAELLSANDTIFLPPGEEAAADVVRRAQQHLRSVTPACPVQVVRRTHQTAAEVHEDVWKVHEMVLPPVAYTELGA